MEDYQPQYGNMPPQEPQYGNYPPQESQYTPYEQPYQAPPQPQPNPMMYQQQFVQQDHTKDVMTVGDYIGTFVLSSIPVVNIICWIVWLCSSTTNKNKKNYIIALIVWGLIAGIISGIIIGIIVAATGVALTDLPYMFY